MIINTEIVDVYLNGEDISKYSSLFIYRQADRSIFQEPEKDKAEIVSKIKDEIIHHVKDFVLTNKRIWDTLFKDWPNELDDIVLDLVVGCKEPNDAFVLKDLNGRHHMIFDLLCWEKYVGKIYLAKEWILGGYTRLKELFDQGYHGFARKCI